MWPGAWSGRSQRWRGFTFSGVAGLGVAASCRRAIASSLPGRLCVAGPPEIRWLLYCMSGGRRLGPGTFGGRATVRAFRRWEAGAPPPGPRTLGVGRTRRKDRRHRGGTSVFDLQGKVAVVTGGNGGIGLGMARGLGMAGAQAVVVGRNEARWRDAVKDPGGRGA